MQSHDNSLRYKPNYIPLKTNYGWELLMEMVHYLGELEVDFSPKFKIVFP